MLKSSLICCLLLSFAYSALADDNSVSPSSFNGGGAVGIKGSYFIDHNRLITDLNRHYWVAAPMVEVGIFYDFYFNAFVGLSTQLFYAHDRGYVRDGRLIYRNSFMPTLLLKGRIPFADKFAVTLGAGLFWGIGTEANKQAYGLLMWGGLVTELAFEVALNYHHVLALGLRYRLGFDSITWSHLGQQPLGISLSYAWRLK